MILRVVLASLVLMVAQRLRADDQPATEEGFKERPVETTLELQVELHRRAFSCGSIDGVMGVQTAAALDAFQRSVGLRATGTLTPETKAKLVLRSPALGRYTLKASELAEIHPMPDTWLGKSQLESMAYTSVPEMVGEKFHTNPGLIRSLNAAVNWDSILVGTTLTVPAVDSVSVEGTPNKLVISLGARTLEVVDNEGRVIAHFPVSIAKRVEKRPVGDLHVVVVAPNPDYTFDPDIITESEEGKALGRKLLIPPGPNNPVGLAWIGLDLPGYGIHGTPEPEKVGRTESHGCFRLANWDAVTLLGIVSVGMVVTVAE